LEGGSAAARNELVMTRPPKKTKRAQTKPPKAVDISEPDEGAPDLPPLTPWEKLNMPAELGDLPALLQFLQARFSIPDHAMQQFSVDVEGVIGSVWFCHRVNSDREGDAKRLAANQRAEAAYWKLVTAAAYYCECFDELVEAHNAKEYWSKENAYRVVAERMAETEGLSSTETVRARAAAVAQHAAIYDLARMKPHSEPRRGVGRPRGPMRNSSAFAFDGFLRFLLLSVLSAGGDWTFDKTKIGKQGTLCKALEEMPDYICLPRGLIPRELPISRIGKIQSWSRKTWQAGTLLPS
jgi:hypothetical protein